MSGFRAVEDSVVALLPSQGYATESLPTLLVLDGDLAGQWNIKNLSDIAVSGTKTYASLDFAKLQDRLRLDNENLIDAQWRKPEDFFTDKLLLVVNREKYVPFEGALEIHGQRNLMYSGRYAVPIPPIQPELLNYLRHIQQLLDAQVGKDPFDIIPQPLFILALKRLLELEMRTWTRGWS